MPIARFRTRSNAYVWTNIWTKQTFVKLSGQKRATTNLFIGGIMAGALGVFLTSPAGAEPSMPDPAAVARNCFICHGQAAKTEGPIPRLNGRPQAALEQALLEFKNDQRSATIMNRIAKGYSDETIAGLAAYLAGLK